MSLAGPQPNPPMRRVAGHPIFGSLRQFRRDQTTFQLSVAREHPEIALARMGFFELLIVSAPGLAQEVLATKADAFQKSVMLSMFLRPVLGEGLVTSEGELHARQRKLIAPTFSHRRVASYAPVMAAAADRWSVAQRDGAVVDIASEMMRVTLEIVGKTVFDAEIGADADAIGSALTIAMECALEQLKSLFPLPPMIPTPSNLKSRRAVAELERVVYRLIAERRANPGDRGDLLSLLLALRDEDGAKMTDSQVRDEAITLLLAGHETTANALAWTFSLLGRHPDVHAKVVAEVDALGHAPAYDDLPKLPYTLAVLKESMRLYPPVYMLGRRPVRPVVIGGHPVPKNRMVLVNVLGIHRRPELYPEPDAFRPERFLGDFDRTLPRCAYLPFGAGPRICIGTHFAMMEAQLILATILRRLRVELLSRRPIEAEHLVTLRPRGGVPVRLSVRS